MGRLLLLTPVRNMEATNMIEGLFAEGHRGCCDGEVRMRVERCDEGKTSMYSRPAEVQVQAVNIRF